MFSRCGARGCKEQGNSRRSIGKMLFRMRVNDVLYETTWRELARPPASVLFHPSLASLLLSQSVSPALHPWPAKLCDADQPFHLRLTNQSPRAPTHSSLANTSALGECPYRLFFGDGRALHRLHRSPASRLRHWPTRTTAPKSSPALLALFLPAPSSLQPHLTSHRLAHLFFSSVPISFSSSSTSHPNQSAAFLRHTSLVDQLRILNLATMSTRKRKQDEEDEEELQALPSDVSEEEEEYVHQFASCPLQFV